MNLQARIETAISDATGKQARFAQSRTAAGGSINDSRIVSMQDGREFFVKTHAQAADYPGMYEAEYEALSLLSVADVIRVPRPVIYDDDFIVLEAFVAGTQNSYWQETMGRQLATLHLNTKTDRFGFGRDNYLGTTQQPNDWMDDWLDFWRDQRLGWQLKLFAEKTQSNDRLLVLGEKLLSRLHDLLAGLDESAVLLHGDLWSGNAAADENGEPIIFDPASYYGQREAEIGMMRLFGGFDSRCEAAYQEVWPLAEGADERISLYRLYHELNHLNLFGGHYYQTCITTMEQLL
ncbi:MAG: fructosamine kinase family protein [Gammaproteobacteria bacterium]|nr:fructosamine kinase family protein [Gammaproteobacteria bacterium]